MSLFILLMQGLEAYLDTSKNKNMATTHNTLATA